MATATKTRPATKRSASHEAAAKEKERAAKAKEKEREAKRKEKEKAAKAKEKDKAARTKAKEQAAKAKEKDKAAKARVKDRAAKARAKDQAARAKEKDKAATAKDQAAKAKAEGQAPKAVRTPARKAVRPPAKKTAEVPAAPGPTAAARTGASAPLLEQVPANDRTVRPKGFIAEALGKVDAVDRSTQRATLAASYTTRDHDVITAWAQTRNGRPADVAGTGGRRRGSGTAGVLRIEFPDGPGDDSNLEGIDWTSFFDTFDQSDVDFLYQERVRTGDVSRFHKFVRAAG